LVNITQYIRSRYTTLDIVTVEETKKLIDQQTSADDVDSTDPSVAAIEQQTCVIVKFFKNLTLLI